MYDHDGPQYYNMPGKIYQQDLHHWYHASSHPKWVYYKDATDWWWHFYTALHNPPTSEKIVNFHYYYPGGGITSQI